MKSKSQASERRRRQLVSSVWVALLSLVVIALIYWEQTALLYILATLGVTALLIVVAVSDLGGETTRGEGAGAGNVDGSESKTRSTFGSVPSASN